MPDDEAPHPRSAEAEPGPDAPAAAPDADPVGPGAGSGSGPGAAGDAVGSAAVGAEPGPGAGDDTARTARLPRQDMAGEAADAPLDATAPMPAAEAPTQATDVPILGTDAPTPDPTAGDVGAHGDRDRDKPTADPEETAPLPAAREAGRAREVTETAPMPAERSWYARAEIPVPVVTPPPADAGWEQADVEEAGRWWMPIVLGLIGLILLGVLVYGLWLIFSAGDDPGPGGTTPATSSARPSPVRTTSRAPSPATTAPTATQPPTAVPVPAVIGKSVADAQRELDRAGLTYLLRYRETDSLPPGRVITTDPPPGAEVPPGTEVTLVIAAEPTPEPPPPPPPQPSPTTPSPGAR